MCARRLILSVLLACVVAAKKTGAASDDISAFSFRNRNANQNVKNCQIVTFDLETTGLDEDDQIVQISAGNDNSTFNVYIIPSKPISDGAAAITGLHLSDGDLYLHNEKVQVFSPKVAFTKFLNYLNTIKSCTILVAHNGFRFDAPRLVKFANELGLLDQLKELVKGFSDSLVIFKTILQDRVREKKRFSMQALAQDFLPNRSTENLHNAEYDVEMLQLLLNEIIENDEVIKTSTKSVDHFLQV